MRDGRRGKMVFVYNLVDKDIILPLLFRAPRQPVEITTGQVPVALSRGVCYYSIFTSAANSLAPDEQIEFNTSSFCFHSVLREFLHFRLYFARIESTFCSELHSLYLFLSSCLQLQVSAYRSKLKKLKSLFVDSCF